MLPYGAMIAVAVADVVAGSAVGLMPLVAVGPAFASLTGGWRRTAAAGACALLLSVGLGVYSGLFAERRGYATMASVVGVTTAGIAAAVNRQRREAEFTSVRAIAEAAQRVLLRPVPRNAGGVRVAVSYTSAVADARIGGDLYEVVASPYGVRAIVGDVQGKGLDAVETAANVLGAFREAAYDEPTLVDLGARLERALGRSLPDERFVTAILVEAGSRDRLTLLCYGHPAPMLVRADGAARFVVPPQRALPLGLEEHGHTAPAPYEHRFQPGDQLLLYTDGVSEARDASGRFYPLDERVSLLKDPDPDTALQALREDILAHTNAPLNDDAAMLLLRYRDR
ncbi:PP2C family protein-serine/threonine phosphatase [Streptomyces boninensis]|uniref:PP2C family protein-serine/threonine phosphatase n=1 Tax=Streptomyces boninensis TaxID=2039455 RepID=UPI003B2123C9